VHRFQHMIPGILVATIVGFAALFLSEHYGAPAMLFALLLGIALSFLYEETTCKAGVEFAGSHILKIGVALLGLRIAFDDVVSLGWKTAVLLLLAIGSTILVGVVLAKLFGLQKRFGVLTGGSVGICGASAAIAISAVLPESKHKERDTLITVIVVTALSTIAMVLYPIIADLLHLDETSTSIFLGGTIHDVAQVVGAGYSVSMQTGDLATLTKLVRVAFLMPVVLCILLVIRMKFTSNSYSNSREEEAGSSTKPAGFPLFLMAFVALMIINSVFSIPTGVTAAATSISSFALVVAIAAIGMKSNLKQLLEVGIKPILLLVLETIWIVAVILLSLPYLR
jgi:uncharacterized integral membrane protein (TIGR00698 family)